jgi:hypothetical protein
MAETHRGDDELFSMADGVVLFAAVTLSLIGVLQVIEGISELAKDDVVVRAGDYVFGFNVTALGCVHLVFGAIAVAVGVGLITGAGWALVGGMVIASVSAILHFTTLALYPWWSLIVIGLDVAIIWALMQVRRRRSTW